MSALELTGELLMAALDRVVAMNNAPVELWVRRARRAHPDASPAQLITALEDQFRTALVTVGAASGAAAAVPGLGTGASLATTGVEIFSVLEATAIFAQAVGEVHGVHVDDVERKRALILAIALGTSGTDTMEQLSGRSGADWGRQLSKGIPLSSIRRANRELAQNFITKYGARQGALAVGRVAPFGVGAAVGGFGNAMLARTSIKAARTVFGPAPAHFPATALFLP